ncbi:ABC1 kinase family protein [Micromonospora echinofusca]|uniref:AarF/ABC1/UbiB kinase family protein n=1 Tax=Micromonospora echinofusca TaxID=47858 RepID=A0ABS3VTU3_MICEH|nr:AarF/UbiB family protein [Micromonospora echinofusca]MBO4207814.1 AarF/ABC1/UbiB kinase family protein [Micromonospora echinofusca]
MLARHALATVPAVARSAPRGSTAVRVVLRDRLRALVCELGASYIKGAQLLSTRQDLLPAAVCETLGQLHDRVPAMSTEQARIVVDTAFAGREWPFAEFDWTPIASGSIACVYRATLHDGREVAVKVRRPGIGPRMHADFALLASGARLMQRLPGMRRLPASEMVGQISEAVLRQLDFETEAESLRMLGGNLSDLDFLRVPTPVDEIRADGILVMEFIPGLRRVTGGELPAETAALAVRRVLHCVYRMLFLDGVVHCDLHPGNLYLDLQGEVVLLDAGFVVHLKPRVRRLFAEFFFNMSRGNGRQCADIIVRSTDNGGAGADLERFRTEIIELVSATHKKSAGEFQLAPFAAKLFDLQRRCGLYAAPEFVFPLLSLLVIEGMINEFDAGVDFQAEAKPVLIKSLLTAVPREPAAS